MLAVCGVNEGRFEVRFALCELSGFLDLRHYGNILMGFTGGDLSSLGRGSTCDTQYRIARLTLGTSRAQTCQVMQAKRTIH